MKQIAVLFLLLPAGGLLAGCADEPSTPERATLAELVAEQDDYDGDRVEAAGVVRRFGEAEGAARLHYVVEDDRKNRVALRPNDVAEPHVDREVTVVGVFHFTEGRGRSIDVERIQTRD